MPLSLWRRSRPLSGSHTGLAGNWKSAFPNLARNLLPRFDRVSRSMFEATNRGCRSKGLGKKPIAAGRSRVPRTGIRRSSWIKCLMCLPHRVKRRRAAEAKCSDNRNKSRSPGESWGAGMMKVEQTKSNISSSQVIPTVRSDNESVGNSMFEKYQCKGASQSGG